MLFRKQPVISFVSTWEGLEDVEEARPVPYRKVMPEWWKDTPLIDPDSGGFTVKKCPGIMDSFLRGFVIRMWQDTTIFYDKSTDRWSTFSGARNDSHQVEAHTNNQFLNHVDYRFLGRDASFVFKTNCPWKIITKPGWSVYQLPLFYHNNNDFTTLPGIIDTDVYHDSNPQLVYFGDGDEVTIKRGTPLALYVPFRREDIDYDVRFMNEADERSIKRVLAHLNSKFETSGFYRLMQKQRDGGSDG